MKRKRTKLAGPSRLFVEKDPQVHLVFPSSNDNANHTPFFTKLTLQLLFPFLDVLSCLHCCSRINKHWKRYFDEFLEKETIRLAALQSKERVWTCSHETVSCVIRGVQLTLWTALKNSKLKNDNPDRFEMEAEISAYNVKKLHIFIRKETDAYEVRFYIFYTSGWIKDSGNSGRYNILEKFRYQKEFFYQLLDDYADRWDYGCASMSEGHDAFRGVGLEDVKPLDLIQMVGDVLSLFPLLHVKTLC